MVGNYSLESLLMGVFAVIVLAVLVYMIVDTLRASLRDRHGSGREIFVAKPGNRPPAKSFKGPDGESYRPDYDVDMTGVILATSPDLATTVAAKAALSIVQESTKKTDETTSGGTK
jgi:hypothetical protein